MKNISKKLLIIFAVTFFASCSSDDDNILDTEKPEISINEPEEGSTFHPGGEIHFDADLSDNQALKSYKFDIHNNFDGHTHGAVNSTVQVASTKQSETISPWSYNESYEIEGNPDSYNAHHHIDIPENISKGAYHFGLIVVDEAGNSSQVYLDIEIVDGDHDHDGDHDDHDHDGDHDHDHDHGDAQGEHGISIHDLEAGDVARGESLHIEADVEAIDHGLNSVNVNIHSHSDEQAADGEEFLHVDETFAVEGNSAAFSQDIEIPSNAVVGEYHMELTVTDNEGNTHAVSAHVHVTE